LNNYYNLLVKTDFGENAKKIEKLSDRVHKVEFDVEFDEVMKDDE